MAAGSMSPGHGRKQGSAACRGPNQVAAIGTITGSANQRFGWCANAYAPRLEADRRKSADAGSRSKIASRALHMVATARLMTFNYENPTGIVCRQTTLTHH